MVTQDTTSYHSRWLAGGEAHVCVSVFSYHQVLVAAELDGGAMHGAVRRVFIWLRDSSQLHTEGKNVTTVHVSR